jgi:hypothetical protein
VKALPPSSAKNMPMSYRSAAPAIRRARMSTVAVSAVDVQPSMMLRMSI